MCGYFACTYICATRVLGARGPNRVLDPLDLESQMFVAAEKQTLASARATVVLTIVPSL